MCAIKLKTNLADLQFQTYKDIERVGYMEVHGSASSHAVYRTHQWECKYYNVSCAKYLTSLSLSFSKFPMLLSNK